MTAFRGCIVAERPILFSAPMVRAILSNAKTQTRRVVKDTGLYAIDAAIHGPETAARELLALATRCPYGQPGQKLWVRETWRERVPDQDGRTLDYRADHTSEDPCDVPWRPSIHMPRAASRITLEVTGVRVERLRDISEADAIAEGIERSGECNWRDYGDPHNDFTSARRSYRSLWDQINGDGAWAANPWVWVVEFKRVEAPRG